MSIEAKDGATLQSLKQTGQYAVRLLPHPVLPPSLR